jgi:thiosulfate/3-mercaptopyruvate sulfurtransferase
MYTSLISTDELEANLNSPNWVIVDCRFDLNDKPWGEEEYAQFHIPGAVYAHMDNDLSSPVTPLTGRHPLPEPEVFIKTLRRLGISNSSQVIVYDSVSGGMSARLWWLLKYYGHEAVAMLNGNLPQWLVEKKPTTEGVETHKPGTFTGRPDNRMIVTTDEVKVMLGKKGSLLIDARAPERFRGEVEPIDTVAGHIPGAMNRFYGNNVDRKGLFLPPETLKAEFLKLLNGIKPEDAVVYCGSGPTSCHHLVAMAYAGLPLPRDYAGSWSEWIRDPSNPVAKG